jgi:ubiquinol-cytochrome c reductase cytochrome c subunit
VTARALMVVLLALALAGAAAAQGHGTTLESPSSDAVTKGSHLYGRYCYACHGPNGAGVIHANPGRIGAGPLRDQARQAGVGPSLQGVGALAADFYLKTGYMPLPRVGRQPRRSRVVLSAGEVDALIAYVTSLGAGPPVPAPHPERGNVARGFHLFADHCAGCHQIVAEGGYVTGGLPPALEDDSAVQIAEAVRLGPYVMPRLSQKALSNAELDSLIAYVEYAKHPDDRGGWALGHLGPVPEGLVTWFIAAAACIGFCVLIGQRLRKA